MMHRPRCVWKQFAGLSVLNFLVLNSLQEFLDRALNLVSLTEFDVLAIVSDLHVLVKSHVLVQLEENAATI